MYRGEEYLGVPSNAEVALWQEREVLLAVVQAARTLVLALDGARLTETQLAAHTACYQALVPARLLVQPGWKTYPMGGAANEHMWRRGLKAELSHAVAEPCLEQDKALCGVKTHSLCMDESLATTELPECPRCVVKIAKLNRNAAVVRPST